MEVSEEDWFYESISRYKNLNMFELEYPVTQVEPASNTSICVSCSNMKRHQLLELSLPSKLMLQAKESSETVITNDTDMKIKCGTFTQAMISQMKALDDRNVFASHVDTKDVTLYKLSSDDSDEIKRESFNIIWDLENPSMAVNGTQMWLTKKRADQMRLFDINTEKLVQTIFVDERNTTYECDERVIPLYLRANVVAFCCQLTGGVMIGDTRDKGTWTLDINKPENELDFWSFTSLYECSKRFSSSCEEICLAKVSKSGTLMVYDTRNMHGPAYVDKTLGLKASTGSPMQVRFSPCNKDLISVSGFDGNVYVYQLRATADPELRFTHDGHKHVDGYSSLTTTTSHVWSKLENLVISSADNGTIQLWQFENK